MGNADKPNIIFAPDTGIIPSAAIIHDDETFQVQWQAFNAGSADSPAFTDLLVVVSVPEGCPPSDDQEHPVVYNSETDGNPQDFLEQPLKAGEIGPVLSATVGPFPAGSYNLVVTVAKDLSNVTLWNCIEISASG